MGGVLERKTVKEGGMGGGGGGLGSARGGARKGRNKDVKSTAYLLNSKNSEIEKSLGIAQSSEGDAFFVRRGKR